MLSVNGYLPFLIVSTTVVKGRRSASLTGINWPVLASRPTLKVLLFLAMMASLSSSKGLSCCQEGPNHGRREVVYRRLHGPLMAFLRRWWSWLLYMTAVQSHPRQWVAFIMQRNVFLPLHGQPAGTKGGSFCSQIALCLQPQQDGPLLGEPYQVLELTGSSYELGANSTWS